MRFARIPPVPAQGGWVVKVGNVYQTWGKDRDDVRLKVLVSFNDKRGIFLVTDMSGNVVAATMCPRAQLNKLTPVAFIEGMAETVLDMGKLP